MLEMKTSCEKCGAALGHESSSAHICSFECTFCEPCAVDIYKRVCPNCSGELVPRPRRRAKA